MNSYSENILDLISEINFQKNYNNFQINIERAT